MAVAASAFVLGEAGQIGTEVAKLLATCGWKVTTLDRGTRAPSPELAELGVQRRVAGVVGSVVAISSASVYRDLRGPTLDEATKHGSFRYCP